jgi:hypothetical protein
MKLDINVIPLLFSPVPIILYIIIHIIINYPAFNYNIVSGTVFRSEQLTMREDITTEEHREKTNNNLPILRETPW